MADPEVVAFGKFPATGLTSDNRPVLCWADNSNVANKRLLYSVRSLEGDWLDPITLASDSSSEFLPPSFLVSNGDTGVVAWTVRKELNSWLVKYGLFEIGQGLNTEVSLDSFSTDMSLQLASVAMDFEGTKHFVWDAAGVISYKTVSETGPATAQVLSRDGRVSTHPSVSAYGDRVYVYWTEESLAESTSSVLWCARELQAEWPEPESLPVSSGTSKYPAVFGPFGLWFGRLGADYYNLCGYLSLEFGEKVASYNMTGSTVDSKFPSIFIDQADTSTYIYYLWVEGLEDRPAKAICYITPSPLPYYSATLGLNDPSRYTVERQGVMSWGDMAYQSADFGSDSLVYSFTNLAASKKYKIGVTFYHEFGDTIALGIEADGQPLDLVPVPSEERVTARDWVPTGLTQDGQLILTIVPVSGEFVVCSEVYVYEYRQPGLGLSTLRSTESTVLQAPYSKLWPLSPDPVRGLAPLKYTLGRDGAVRVTIYDISGRRITSLTDKAPRLAGTHTVLWDLTDNQGNPVSSGVYFCRLEALGRQHTRKFVLLR